MFPTIVYKIPGPFKGPKGHTHHWKGVKNEIEMAKALAEGYHKTMEDALNPPKEKKPEYEVGLKDAKDVDLKPKPIKNLDGEEITPGAIGELPKRKAGRPKKKKEIFGDDV